MATAALRIVSDQARLRRLIAERSLRRGDFVLASGGRSSYYVDARLSTMSGVGQLLVGREGLRLLDEAGWTPGLVGGLTLGADPVAYAIAHAAARVGRGLDAFTVRKEPKAHGTEREIEGPFFPGADVVVVEDSLTTGGSALRAVQAVRRAGGRVLGVFTLVDREEGARERLAKEGIDLLSAYTAAELLAGS